MSAEVRSDQWRSAANELRRSASEWDGKADRPVVCGLISASGPNGEPLGCGYQSGHVGSHSWSTLEENARPSQEKPE